MAVKGLQLNITKQSFGSSIPKMDFGGSKLGIKSAKIKSTSLLDSPDSLRSENDGALTSKDFETKTGKLTNILKRVTFRVGKNEKAIEANAKKITLVKKVIQAQQFEYGGKEDPLEDTNKLLEDIGTALAIDFAFRVEQGKREIQEARKEKEEKKRSLKERMVEGIKGTAKKGAKVGGNIAGAIAKPFSGLFGGIKEVLTLLGAAVIGNNALDWLKNEENQQKIKNFFGFIAEHWKTIAAVVAGLVGLYILKKVWGLIKLVGKVIQGIWKIGKWIIKTLKTAKNIFKGLKNLKTGAKLTKIATRASIAVGGKTGGKITQKLLTKQATKQATKQTTKTAAKIVAKKTAAKTTQKIVAKTTTKAATKAAGKGIGKAVAKKIPLLGLGLGAVFAVQRAMAGDWSGAALELASGAASTVPGVGTAVSVGLDAALIAKDINTQKKLSETEAQITPSSEEDLKTEIVEMDLPPVKADVTIPEKTPGEITEVINISSLNLSNSYMEDTPVIHGIV